jgi:hypothetical protein
MLCWQKNDAPYIGKKMIACTKHTEHQKVTTFLILGPIGLLTQ